MFKKILFLTVSIFSINALKAQNWSIEKIKKIHSYDSDGDTIEEIHAIISTAVWSTVKKAELRLRHNETQSKFEAAYLDGKGELNLLTQDSAKTWYEIIKHYKNKKRN